MLKFMYNIDLIDFIRRCEDMRKSENVKDTLRFERVGSAMQRAGRVCNILKYFLNRKDAKTSFFC